MLKSSRGALMWHGRNLRHFKRLLAPPLQELLTQPGSAVLGRGLASLPAEAAHQMGGVQARGREAGGLGWRAGQEGWAGVMGWRDGGWFAQAGAQAGAHARRQA